MSEQEQKAVPPAGVPEQIPVIHQRPGHIIAVRPDGQAIAGPFGNGNYSIVFFVDTIAIHEVAKWQSGEGATANYSIESSGTQAIRQEVAVLNFSKDELAKLSTEIAEFLEGQS